MRFLKAFLPVLVFGILAVTPQAAFAAEATFFGPIIPTECHCVGSAPDFACVLATIQNAINLAISVGVIIFVLVCAYAGFLFMFSSVNAENKSKAKNVLTNAVVGLLIALAAWLLVDFMMKTLYNPATQDQSGKVWGPWNSILGDGTRDDGTTSYCLLTHTPPERSTGEPTTGEPTTGDPSPRGGLPANGSVTVAGGSCAGNTRACGPNLRCGTTADGDNKDRCIANTTTGSGSTCSGCVTLTSVSVANKGPTASCGGSGACVLRGGCDEVPVLNPPASACQVQSSFASKLRSALRSGMWVTEAWPPTRNHSNACHKNGTCVDADYQDNRSDAASINAFITSATAQGLGVVYELGSVGACTAIRDAGVSEQYLDVVSGITGAHFSVYDHSVGTQPGCR